MVDFFKQPGFMRVGVGNASYTMNRGSFKTKDKLTNSSELSLFEHKGNDYTYQTDQYKVLMQTSIQNQEIICTFTCSDNINRLWLRLPSSPQECIFGCGEQFTHFNLKGKNVPIWVSEHHSLKKLLKKAIRTKLFGENDEYLSDFKHHQTYIAQPTYVTSDKVLVHVDTNSYCEFDFTSDLHTVLHFRSIPTSIIIFQGTSMIECVQYLNKKLGKHPRLPDWVSSGGIVASQGGWDKAFDYVHQIQANQGKIAAIWSQDWSGQLITKFGTQVYWNWQVDNNLYPAAKQKIKELNAMGVAFLGYINTFLKEYTPLYEEAKQKNFLVMTHVNTVYLIKSTTFKAGIVDLSNPEAFEWYKRVIQHEMIDLGMSGWMADFGEYLPTDSIIFDPRGAQDVHNIWPDLWAKCNFEAIQERGVEQEIFVFNRAGFTNTHRYTHSMWVGDQHVDFSKEYGLPSVIVAMLSLSMIGKGISHSDIGGYTTIFHMKRDEELLMRWCEMNVFTPVFRTHEGNRPESNVQINSNPTCVAHYAKMSRLFASLQPYHQCVLDEYEKESLPVIRPMFFASDLKEAYELQYQYMYGSHLIIAPVLSKHASSVRVWLPTGTWVHLFSKSEFTQGWVNIDAPIGQPAVFYKKEGQWSNFFEHLSVY